MYFVLLILSITILTFVFKTHEETPTCSLCGEVLCKHFFLCQKCKNFSYKNMWLGYGSEMICCYSMALFAFSLFKLIIGIDNMFTKLISLAALVGAVIMVCAGSYHLIEFVKELYYNEKFELPSVFKKQGRRTATPTAETTETAVVEQEGTQPDKPKKIYRDDPNLTLALISASAKGDMEQVKHLIENNVNPNAREETEGLRPIMAALKYGHVEVFHYLHEQGAQLRVVDKFGQNLEKYVWAGIEKVSLTDDYTDDDDTIFELKKIAKIIENR